MQPILEYKKTEVNSSDNVRIIALLYDGAINFIRIAKKKMEQGDIPAKCLYVGKATAIVSELSISLNMDTGEIAKNLRMLYDYLLDRLLYANLKNDLKALNEAERILEILSVAWKDMQREILTSKNPAITSNNKGIELKA